MRRQDSLDKQITQALFQEGNSISASVKLKTAIDARIDAAAGNQAVRKSAHRKTEVLMKKINVKWAVAAAAALCILIPTGVYAGGKITGYASSLKSGSTYTSYGDLEESQKDAGFTFASVESFSNGYTFSEMEISDVDKIDDEFNRMDSFKEWWGRYTREDSPEISLVIHGVLPEAAEDTTEPTETTVINGVNVSYNLDHYKFVPENYELTAEDEANMAGPHYYISYGSDTVEESDVSYITWNKEGIQYSLMCFESAVEAEELYEMAGEIMMQ